MTWIFTNEVGLLLRSKGLPRSAQIYTDNTKDMAAAQQQIATEARKHRIIDQCSINKFCFLPCFRASVAKQFAKRIKKSELIRVISGKQKTALAVLQNKFAQEVQRSNRGELYVACPVETEKEFLGEKFFAITNSHPCSTDGLFGHAAAGPHDAAYGDHVIRFDIL